MSGSRSRSCPDEFGKTRRIPFSGPRARLCRITRPNGIGVIAAPTHRGFQTWLPNPPADTSEAESEDAGRPAGHYRTIDKRIGDFSLSLLAGGPGQQGELSTLCHVGDEDGEEMLIDAA